MNAIASTVERRRLVSAALLTIVGSVHAASNPAASPNVTAEDYARAERFLAWNKSRYAANADIEHHWIGKEDRFWYWRTAPDGTRERIVVDARTGEKSRAPEAEAAEPAPAAAPREIASPDGEWVVHAKDYNLWARSVREGREFALTMDGSKQRYYATYDMDPVTQERFGSAVRIPPDVLWSPDSKYLLTHQLDESRLTESHLIQAVPEDGSLREKLYSFPMSRPGDDELATQKLVIFDLRTREQRELGAFPLKWKSMMRFRHAWWSEDSRKVYFLSSGRFLRSVSLNVYDIQTGRRREILRETADTPIRINGSDWGGFDCPAVRTLRNGDVIWYSERDGWAHLYYYDGVTGRLRNRITQGAWVVRDIVRVDEAARNIYFTANGRESGRNPGDRYLYRVRFDGSGLKLLTPEDGEHGPYSTFLDLDHRDSFGGSAFSPSGRYFVDTVSRPDSPPVLSVRRADGSLVARVEEADITQLRRGGYTPIESFQVLAGDGKTPIYGNLFRPSHFDASRQYPLIDAVYPGPQVTRTRRTFTAALFDGMEAQSLAELGFIVITLDGRGTPHRSRAFRDYSYGRLDRASDLEDHIAGIRQLAQRYPYIDIDRVGIDGASGGGYQAARAVLAYPDFYKVAVSAVGNHDQRLHWARWGESFIGPVNEHDYLRASNIPLAANLRGKLLLAHGELDDRVLPFATLRMADALIKANRDFDMLIMPNVNHGISGSPYFIRRKWDYFVRHLLGAQPPDNYLVQGPRDSRSEAH